MYCCQWVRGLSHHHNYVEHPAVSFGVQVKLLYRWDQAGKWDNGETLGTNSHRLHDRSENSCSHRERPDHPAVSFAPRYGRPAHSVPMSRMRKARKSMMLRLDMPLNDHLREDKYDGQEVPGLLGREEIDEASKCQSIRCTTYRLGWFRRNFVVCQSGESCLLSL